MHFFADASQGLNVVAAEESLPIKIVDDGGYQCAQSDFAAAYVGFNQSDYIQLPGKVIRASKITEYKNQFKFLTTEELKKMNEKAAREEEDEAVVSDGWQSVVQELKENFQQREDPLDFDDLESKVSVAAMSTEPQNLGETLETLDTQSYSPSAVPSAFDRPEDVFKVPFGRANPSSRDYDVNMSDASSETFDNKTLLSDSDTSSSSQPSIIGKKNKRKFLR